MGYPEDNNRIQRFKLLSMVAKNIWNMQVGVTICHTIIRQTNAYGRKDNNFVTEQINTQMLTHQMNYLGYGEIHRNPLYSR